jgi:fructosamine-3-kinase
VIGIGEDDDNQFILLDFVEQGPQTETYWKDLGVRLANLTQNHYTSVRARSRQLHRFASPI